MSRAVRVAAEFRAAWRGFVRRPTAVFFTFFFPVLLVVIFTAFVGAGAGGLFDRGLGYYVPGYLATVVLLTPLSRVSSEVTRHREGKRFEKLAATPLSPSEWLLARTLVNCALVLAASALIVALLFALTAGGVVPTLALLPAVALGSVLFCGVGALIGRLADSQDGAIAASNGIGFPLLFLSETFIPPETLPAWSRPVVALSPLTYFSRAVRTALPDPDAGLTPATLLGTVDADVGVLAILALAAFAAGASALPWRT